MTPWEHKKQLNGAVRKAAKPLAVKITVAQGGRRLTVPRGSETRVRTYLANDRFRKDLHANLALREACVPVRCGHERIILVGDAYEEAIDRWARTANCEMCEARFARERALYRAEQDARYKRQIARKPPPGMMADTMTLGMWFERNRPVADLTPVLERSPRWIDLKIHAWRESRSNEHHTGADEVEFVTDYKRGSYSTLRLVHVGEDKWAWGGGSVATSFGRSVPKTIEAELHNYEIVYVPEAD